MSDNVFELKNIKKTYKTGTVEVPVLKDISLSVKRGEYISIMGASGSGKTTLMNILGCLDRPSAGEYYLDNQLVEGLTDDELAKIRNEKIGFVFQSFNLLPKLTALENVALPMVYAHVGRDERNERAKELLESLGLGERLDHCPNNLSGGQRQRVAIARALANDPSFIMADEPTGNLDTKASFEVMQIFKELHASGRTIIMVTHEADIAAQTKRTIILSDGVIIDDYENENEKENMNGGSTC